MNCILFKAASETLTSLALDKKYLGAQIGVTMLLHTWGQNLCLHPHVHCIVPGGGLSPSGITFIKSKKKFFIPVKVLSKMFRDKFLYYFEKAANAGEVSFTGSAAQFNDVAKYKMLIDELYQIKWVVYCKKPFKENKSIVEYLSRYTHKTAIKVSAVF